MSEEAASREYEWLSYYDKFSYCSRDSVRDGCHPRMRIHDKPSDKAIVLVHGLTDSPYYMGAIADHFFNVLQYDVYIPLLHLHGLKDPKGLEGIRLEEWLENVRFAVDTAASSASTISIGGLSTGGALSYYTAINDKRINGTLYLFSAALDLADRRMGISGRLTERMARTFLVELFDNNSKTMIGKNPYRYARMDLDGVRELSRLIRRTDNITKRYNRDKLLPLKIFAAHSESDGAAAIRGIEALEEVADPKRFFFYRIKKTVAVAHASLVLKRPVMINRGTALARILEKANPEFDKMMDAITRFEAQNGSSSS